MAYTRKGGGGGKGSAEWGYLFKYSSIQRFHSRGHHLCQFIGTKESKSLIPAGFTWHTNMAAVSLFWDTNIAAVTSCENTLYQGWEFYLLTYKKG